jgi:hypothetical protein
VVAATCRTPAYGYAVIRVVGLETFPKDGSKTIQALRWRFVTKNSATSTLKEADQ